MPESDVWSVGVTVSPCPCSDRSEDIGVPAGEIPGGEAERGRGELPHLLLHLRRRPPSGPGGTVRSAGPQQIQVMHLVHCTAQQIQLMHLAHCTAQQIQLIHLVHCNAQQILVMHLVHCTAQ